MTCIFCSLADGDIPASLAFESEHVVAFHDIYPRPSYGVSQLWAEMTAQPGARYLTICQNEVMPGAEGLCGTGVLWR